MKILQTPDPDKFETLYEAILYDIDFDKLVADTTGRKYVAMRDVHNYVTKRYASTTVSDELRYSMDDQLDKYIVDLLTSKLTNSLRTQYK